jgi:branched-chain amino acid transport system permease protein
MFNQLLLNGIIAGSIYALIALGFTVIYKTVRFFHSAHIDLMSLWVKS